MAAKPWSLLTPAVDALKNTIAGLIRDVKKHLQVAAGFYAEAQDTPDQTIAIYAGIVYFGITKVEYAGLAVVDLGTGGAFQVSALTANYYNKVLFTIDSAGTLAMTEGTEAAAVGDVVAPAIPAGKYPICMVTVQDDGTATAGTILTIAQSDIQQIQGINLLSTIATDTIWAAAGDLTVGTGNDTAGILSKGAANLKLFMNAAGATPEWANGIKVGTFTRDVSVGAGDVAYTGVGFKPSMIIFISNATESLSVGFDDGTTHHHVAVIESAATEYTYGAYAFQLIVSFGTDYTRGIVKTMDADGFTITYTKASTPAGTFTIGYIAFR